MLLKPLTSIRSKILAVMGGLVLVCALIFSLVFVPLTRNHLVGVLKQTNHRVLQLLNSHVSLWFEQRHQEVESYGRNPIILRGTPQEITDFLKLEAENKINPLLLLFRANALGDYSTNEKPHAGNLLHRDYFSQVMAGSKIISDPLISNSTGRPILVVAGPLREGTKIVGVMGESIDLQSFYNFFQLKISNSEFKQVMIADKSGRVLVHSRPSAVFTDSILSPSSNIPRDFASKSQEILQKDEGIFETLESDHQSALVFYQTIPQTGGLKLILQIPLDQTQIFLDNLQTSLTVLSILIVALGLLFVWILAHRVSKPLQVLREVFDKAASGDLSVQAPELSTDEIGQASRSFNVMMKTIRNLTYYDAVTGLPNRAYFDDALRRLVTQETTSQQKGAVGIIALDKFKNINDAHGSTVGDRVLKEMGQRILLSAGDQSFVARGSSAEYHVFFGNLLNRRNAISQMSGILMEISKPFNVQTETLFLTASAGLCFYPLDSKEPEDLLINASIAKSAAKKAGGNTLKLFNETMRQSLSAQMHIEALLHRALEHKELTLVYQPQVDALTRKLVGMEALLRWNNKELGNVPPAVFIPLAEESGLIVAIGDWVLQQACQQNKIWLDMGLPIVPVAVNVSAWQFDQNDFLDKVEAVIEDSGLPREYLELEITESVAMGQVEDKIRRLQTLADSGIRISIDDFGTGYSSLNYLKQFPVHTLKIDQSFVREVPQDRDSMAIVETVITMGRNFKMEIIAEGVETQAQFDFIQQGGCHKIQGFFISRPLNPEQMEKILRGDLYFLI